MRYGSWTVSTEIDFEIDGEEYTADVELEGSYVPGYGGNRYEPPEPEDYTVDGIHIFGVSKRGDDGKLTDIEYENMSEEDKKPYDVAVDGAVDGMGYDDLSYLVTRYYD